MIYETDSRLVKPGQIFVAIKGHTVDGHDYIDDAIKNGASTVVGEKDLTLSVPYIKVEDSEKYLQEEIVKKYKNELDEIEFIGVTGTNGKTTTCYLTYQLLKLLKKDVAYIGTIGFYYQDEIITLNNTTPDILTLYKLLLSAKEKNCHTIVMEVSSHALDLNRVAGITFKVAGFTNLTQDHLDYHKTMDNYLNAKLKILDHLNSDSIFITNIDDKYGDYFKKFPNTKTYGKDNADYKIINEDISPSNTTITFSHNNETFKVTTNLTSDFNVYNYMLSLAIVNSLNFDINTIIDITKNIYPPKGRCETIKVKDSFAVIDYAHTPDAVKKIIEAYNKLKKGKLYTIVGCGGDRDKTKRPIMGNIACKLSDYCIFTSDNPRTEDPLLILKDITNDLEYNNFLVIPDRKEAIIKALKKLKKDDILLILGKGHENYQIIGHTKHHFDDAEIVNDYKTNC